MESALSSDYLMGFVKGFFPSQSFANPSNPTSAVRHDFHLIWPIWSTNRVCFLCLDLLGGRVVPTYPLD